MKARRQRAFLRAMLVVAALLGIALWFYNQIRDWTLDHLPYLDRARGWDRIRERAFDFLDNQQSPIN